MELYIGLYLFIMVLSFFDFININESRKKSLILFTSLVLVILASVRWQTGTDWDMYFNLFNDNNTIDDYWRIANDVQAQEFGFGILNWLIKTLFDDYNILLLCIAMIIVMIKYNWYIKYMPFPLVAMFINFSTYLGDIFFVRQTLAIAITIFAFRYIVKKDLSRFLFFVCIASSIHTSALIFIPAYWIYYIRMSAKKIFTLLILCISINVTNVNMYILNWFMDTFPSDMGKIVQKVWAYYLLNQSGENHGNVMDDSSRIFLAYIRRIMLIPIYVYCTKFISECNKFYLGCLNLVIFGHILFFLTSIIAMDFAGRIAAYYYIYEVLLLTSLLACCKNKFNRIAIYCLIIAYCFSKYIYVFYNLGTAYIPYMHVL